MKMSKLKLTFGIFFLYQTLPWQLSDKTTDLKKGFLNISLLPLGQFISNKFNDLIKGKTQKFYFLLKKNENIIHVNDFQISTII
jgi:hypothetical protein